MKNENSQKNTYTPESPNKQGGSFPLRNDSIKKSKKAFTIEEFRKVTGDNISSSAKIQEKIDYIYGFCRNVIKIELEKHVSNN